MVQESAMHIQHMQKALQQMNLLLHNVVTDITGMTGMKIIKAISCGQFVDRSCIPAPAGFSTLVCSKT
jgi:transposase